MGGLVAKKAYLLAKQSKEYERFSGHVRNIFFLATPHRGSNLAELLSRILQVSAGARPFVTDLQPNSATIQAINDEFPRFSGDLNLFSFYETLPMTIGVQKKMVVPKESATLGYGNERTMYLDANHREVCKFDTTEDPNYRAVRNALAEAFAAFRRAVGLTRKATNFEQQQWINDSLDVSDSPEDDFLRADALRVPGSCEWINGIPAFQRWRDDGRPQLFWLTAKPGAGKSILSGHVLRSLRDMDRDCGFFFFSHGDKVKSTMGRFFRYMAWQMASTNLAVFDSLSKICKRDPQLAQADYRTIWRKLFLECIFKHTPSQPHYWVIDALDECKTDSELVPYLLQAANTGFIRVFLSSRTNLDSYGLPLTLPVEVHVETVSESTTQADIQLYLEANVNNLPGRNREVTSKLLLAKSSGCFLWVRLALQELRRASTRAGIQQILEETPSDMDDLYNRILDSVYSRAREKEMIMAILDWTACAARPLTTSELYHALKLDMNDEIDDDIQRFIENNCGQIVVIESSDHVRMIHSTARDFLFSPKNTSAIRLGRKVGHKRLATVCLKYLCGPEMAGPKPRKLSATTTVTQRSDFVAYASESLAQHLPFVSSDDDEFAQCLVRFLKSPNLLSWVEFIAKESDLSRLIQTGTALRKYLQRRTKNMVPFGTLGKDLETVDAWATDMIRLVTKFGSNLQETPSAIFSLIPPFCPGNSALRSQHASSTRSIRVSGLSMQDWDDCISTITLPASPSAVACGTSVFAVGMQNGNIAIFDAVTCQARRTLHHEEPVKKLLFGEIQGILVSAGLRKICIWSTDTWQLHWSFEPHSQFISLALTDQDKLLLVTYRANELVVFDIATRMERENLSWLDEDTEDVSSHFRRPITTAISGDQTHLAYAYRGEDVVVWDIENACTYDVYGKDEGSLGLTAGKRKGIASAWSIIFSRAPESKLLVVGYNDGMLSLFNIAEGTVQAKAAANGHTLASSPDGLTLACGSSAGHISIFEFDTLKLLHRIQAEETNIKQLAFSADGHNLLDIQGAHCRVWDPPVLIRQDLDEENSDTVSVSTSPIDVKIDDSSHTALLTSMAHDESGSIVLCGKDNGTVHLFDPQSGFEQKQILNHTVGTQVVHLQFDSSSCILASCDSSSRIITHQLARDRNSWSVVRQLMEVRVGMAVNQILLKAGGSRLLVSSTDEDILYDLTPGNCRELTRLHHENSNAARRWCSYPLNEGLLTLAAGTEFWLYDWTQLHPVSDRNSTRIELEQSSKFVVTSIYPCFDNTYLATMTADSSGPRMGPKLMFWDVESLSTNAETISPAEHFQPLADHVRHFVGSYNHRVVFLHADGWICSADSHSFHEEYYDRHFFIPSDWLSTAGSLKIEMLRNGTILFVKRHELAIVKRGLEHFEHGHSKGLGKRPSISRSAMSDPTDGILAHAPSLSRR
jgi:WD40 repeat protein